MKKYVWLGYLLRDTSPIIREALIPWWLDYGRGISPNVSSLYITHGGMENVFFEKKQKRREMVPLTLHAFDFSGRYIRRFIPEGLLLIYERILTLIKHKMIWNKQLPLESYGINIALRVLHKEEVDLGLLPYPTWSTLW